MKSPKDMRIIQIDITNACIHACSNCTRFCGHHKKPFFMDFDTFKKAVDSMEGYVGTVGIMGGEPTLHPEFERFAAYIKSKYPNAYGKANNLLYPQKEFIKAIFAKEQDNSMAYDSGMGARYTINGPGLWSSAGPSYKKHYETIQDVFLYQAYNDHINEMYHQPVLITRKELGIADDEWVKLRDECWIQNEWSASITPKGAFFCEIAASLDMLLGGPGGWPIEPGWWEKKVDEFGEQLNWCECCGIACNTFTRHANEGIDDVSPHMHEKLAILGSPKLKAGKTSVVKIDNGIIADESKASDKRFGATTPYIEAYEDRFHAAKSELYPQGFSEIIICESRNGVCADAIKAGQFDKTYVLCRCQSAFREWGETFGNVEGVEILLIDKRLGISLNKLLWDIDQHYVLLHSNNVIMDDMFCDSLKKCVINPGVLHYIDFSRPQSRDTKYVKNTDTLTEGFAALLHKNALSLRKIGFDGIAVIDDFRAVAAKWDKRKIIELSAQMDYTAPETDIRADSSYAIYGTGGFGEEAFRQIKEKGAKLVCVVDSAPEKWGGDFHGTKIQRPEYLRDKADCFDRVVIASRLYYSEIKERLVGLGVALDKIGLLC